MQAYYEIETEIPTNHQLHLNLPSEIPVGRAKVAIIYELESSLAKQAQMAIFLMSLPDLVENGVSRESIQAFLRQERDHWGD